jgi:carbonic anhydrase
MLDQTMAWIIGVVMSTLVTGSIVYGLKKIRVNEHSSSHDADNSHGREGEPHSVTTTKGNEQGAVDHSSPSSDHDSEEHGHDDLQQEVLAPDEVHNPAAQPHHGSNANHNKPSAKVAQAGEHASWKYSGDFGPEKWGNLDPSFERCGTGSQQSPINFQTVTPSDRDMPVEFHYRDLEVSWGYNGHTLLAEVGPGSYINFERKRYQLVQFHFHTPSEHTVHGEAYPAEVHFVHKSADGKLAVIGLLIKAGDPNDAIQELLDKTPRVAGKKAKITAFTPTRVLPSQGYYYSYLGSLTTPPCNEDVRWVVMKQPIEMSSRQLASLSNIMGSNARPVQPLNGRKPRLEGVEFNAH